LCIVFYTQWHRNECKSRGTCPAQIAGIFLVVPLHFFGSTSTISRFGERFRDGQYSLVSLLFAVLLLTVPPWPVICKSGGTCPLGVLWSRRHCSYVYPFMIFHRIFAVLFMFQCCAGKARILGKSPAYADSRPSPKPIISYEQLLFTAKRYR